MRNTIEFAWIIAAITATALATFMLMSGAVAVVYWLLGRLGLAA